MKSSYGVLSYPTSRMTRLIDILSQKKCIPPIVPQEWAGSWFYPPHHSFHPTFEPERAVELRMFWLQQGGAEERQFCMSLIALPYSTSADGTEPCRWGRFYKLCTEHFAIATCSTASILSSGRALQCFPIIFQLLLIEVLKPLCNVKEPLLSHSTSRHLEDW